MNVERAKREFGACTLLVGNLNQLHVLVRRLSVCIHTEPGERSEFTEKWTCYLVEWVRENSGLTHGHTQQHWEGMPWQSCRHCMGRLLGEWEFEALEEAVSRMLTMLA
jgi:hypothetical protein